MAREEPVEMTVKVTSKAPFLGHAKGEEFTAELTPSQARRAQDRGNIEVLDGDLSQPQEPEENLEPDDEESPLLPPAPDDDNDEEEE